MDPADTLRALPSHGFLFGKPGSMFGTHKTLIKLVQQRMAALAQSMADDHSADNYAGSDYSADDHSGSNHSADDNAGSDHSADDYTGSDHSPDPSN